ncbi:MULTISPECIES: hypothetical protein [Laceyella]|jgi:hypothetical protein|uniref:Uncharacterized protein n=1 Tax=Laceyella sediminis TaxID=573074 RepID=A0ABX5EM70_9BACL|nr:hypothetical protein [Laceyella sediminis]KPC77561.1 hypothetical protein ADL26_02145 [Thermoactinomyces vulgaris]MRG29341.1 hypothetical protein [Laceyella tengchongensis]PRZ13275.1 hypothetical protein CLV36_10984 [Laceyella sediminis]
MQNKTEKLVWFLKENRPSDLNADVVWEFVVMLVQDEGLTIRDLIVEYYLYTSTRDCGSQGIRIRSNYDGTTSAGVGSRKYTCDEEIFVQHWKKTMDAYISMYHLN